MQENRRGRCRQISIGAGVIRPVEGATAEGRLHVTYVLGRRVRNCQALDQAVGQELRRVLVEEEVVEQALDLVESLLAAGRVAQREGGRVPKLMIREMHREFDVLEETPSAAEDGFAVDHATAREGLDLPTAACGTRRGRRRRESTDLQPSSDLHSAGQRVEGAACLRAGGAAAGGALGDAAGRARPAGVLGGEAVAPQHRKLGLLRHVVPVDANAPVEVHHDGYVALLRSPQVVLIVAAGVACRPDGAYLHAAARAPGLGLGEG
mmetsp:Transcript_1657/g.4542  ORF Transcript_1657/g.4542 Transcript_1657/m.4542 type:complete len:265 (-) Transcript_1657:672-1466(-)